MQELKTVRQPYLKKNGIGGVSNCRVTIKEASYGLSVARKTTLDVCYSRGTLVRISANGQITLLILG